MKRFISVLSGLLLIGLLSALNGTPIDNANQPSVSSTSINSSPNDCEKFTPFYVKRSLQLHTLHAHLSSLQAVSPNPGLVLAISSVEQQLLDLELYYCAVCGC